MATTVVTTAFGRRLMETIRKNNWGYLSNEQNGEFCRSMSAAVGMGTGIATTIWISYKLSYLKEGIPMPFIMKWPFSTTLGIASGYLTYMVVASPTIIAAFVTTITPVLIGQKLKKMDLSKRN